MFSTLTERGATATIDALSLGADDYVTKASNEGSLDRSMSALQSELIPKLKQFFLFESDAPAAKPVFRAPSSVKRTAKMQAVVIGVSTGGPTALAEVIPKIPADFRLPILIVQHMPPVFTRLLAERLQANSKLRVHEAANGMAIEPGHVYIAPGDFHMRIARKGTGMCVVLDQGPQENSCRPAVDVLFRSAEEIWGADVLSVILTGMGFDGLRGAEVLKARGAELIAQDEASSVVWGMPGAVANAGLADAILPLTRIAPEILQRTGH
jgi:two-component system chemotaxis response regulator CheB